jgi:uncharacterized protein (DUF4213/DUF364 family)
LTTVNIVETLISRADSFPGAAAARTLDVRIGPFWTAVHTSSGAGMASTMAADARPHEALPVPDAGRLGDRSPVVLTGMMHSTSPTEAAVGLAAVNALLGFPEGRVTESKAVEVLGELGRERTVALIGRFPFAESLRPACDRLWVFERAHGFRPSDHTADEMPELLPQADVVAITATTLLNRTLDEVLSCVSKDAWLMMLGPSTPMSSCLFELGFDALCGTIIDDPEAVLTAVSQGAVTSQIPGVRRLCLWR